MNSSQQPGRADARATSLGVLLAAEPASLPFERAFGLLKAALRRRWQGYLYLKADAVEGLGDTRLTRMRAEGLKVFACAADARDRGIECADQAVFCGLATLSDLISRADRFLIFPPTRLGRSRGRATLPTSHGVAGHSHLGQGFVSNASWRLSGQEVSGARVAEPPSREPLGLGYASSHSPTRICLMVDAVDGGRSSSAALEAARIAQGVAPWGQVSAEVLVIMQEDLAKGPDSLGSGVDGLTLSLRGDPGKMNPAHELAEWAKSFNLLAWF